MTAMADEPGTTTVRGACPHDCPDTCAMLVSVRDGRAVKVRGDSGHPFTCGGLCVKVNNYVDKVTALTDRFSEANILTADRYGYPVSLQQQYTVTDPALLALYPNAPTIQQIITNGERSAQTYEEIAKNLRTPYIMQSAITVERQLPKNTTVSLSYLNSHGLHELRSQDINAPSCFQLIPARPAPSCSWNPPGYITRTS